MGWAASWWSYTSVVLVTHQQGAHQSYFNHTISVFNVSIRTGLKSIVAFGAVVSIWWTWCCGCTRFNQDLEQRESPSCRGSNDLINGRFLIRVQTSSLLSWDGNTVTSPLVSMASLWGRWSCDDAVGWFSSDMEDMMASSLLLHHLSKLSEEQLHRPAPTSTPPVHGCEWSSVRRRAASVRLTDLLCWSCIRKIIVFH